MHLVIGYNTTPASISKTKIAYICVVYIFAIYEKGYWKRSLSLSLLALWKTSVSLRQGFSKIKYLVWKWKMKGVKVFLMFKFSLQIITIMHLGICQKWLISTPILSLFLCILFNFVALSPCSFHGALCLGNANRLGSTFLPN